ncbi:MAG: hypothetical protein EPN31_14055 [Castellaniella sp.]|uniref:hypothetical protein n=1 Tax=Castellaniella sp. TaxID=1955812 RepID=UPI00120D5DEF|nr:hypothetical protein [Castellaniella sp.]TAN26039.1 MAG: hypothetical protein EPN31_14055 [Castellaniella sp.]
MPKTDMLAGLDAWLAAPAAGDSATLTAPAPDLRKPQIGTVPATGKAAANDPARGGDHMTFHDLAESPQVKVRTEVRAETEVTTVSAQAIEWRPLADAYYRHHFACGQCIAAGMNPDLRRCDAGMELWTAYRLAFDKATDKRITQ